MDKLRRNVRKHTKTEIVLSVSEPTKNMGDHYLVDTVLDFGLTPHTAVQLDDISLHVVHMVVPVKALGKKN